MEDKKVDFPILCETCLGDNPFIRMTKHELGQACKICDRPFAIFRWRPGARARFKKTQICKTCAQLKNVCQTCILDLQFGLPVQVRDKAISDSTKISIPVNVANRDYQFENLEKQLEENGPNAALGQSGSANPYAEAAASTLLSGLARKRPYYTRNLPHLCSFFERGECKRGADCPYRHEKNEYPPELHNQKIKNRFYGVDDPVAKKLLRSQRAHEDEPSQISPPENKSIVTLFVGGIEPDISEKMLRETFQKYGEISLINIIPAKACAFVSFFDRADAEKAIDELKGSVLMKDRKLKLNWSKTAPEPSHGLTNFSRMDLPPGMSSLPTSFIDPQTNQTVRMPLPPTAVIPRAPGASPTPYPSMNPRNYSANFSGASRRY